jgi:hypothetical protein
MAQLPRGISPEILLSQVQSTMPYLFEDAAAGTSVRSLEPARFVRENEKPGKALDHFEYFRLCLSAHYLSCGTPVPTDVDNQIRLKLWPARLPIETAIRMAELVLQARRWNFIPVSTRYAYGAKDGPCAKEAVDGHLGEWFTVAAGAYCGLKRYAAPEAAAKRGELFAEISDEVRRHSEIFGSLMIAGDGVGCLKASASLAHNFGDLDRVMDMWELGIEDPLRLEFYRLGITPYDANRKLRYSGRLWIAGELYKSPIDGSAMALENHRHFALRKPRALRRSPEFLIPTGPFFDHWGRTVARGLVTPEGAPSEETHEVIDALVRGWDLLAKTVGYGRALRGFLELHPEMVASMWAKDASKRRVLDTDQANFEKIWGGEALRWMDEIPSRA